MNYRLLNRHKHSTWQTSVQVLAVISVCGLTVFSAILLESEPGWQKVAPVAVTPQPDQKFNSHFLGTKDAPVSPKKEVARLQFPVPIFPPSHEVFVASNGTGIRIGNVIIMHLTDSEWKKALKAYADCVVNTKVKTVFEAPDKIIVARKAHVYCFWPCDPKSPHPGAFAQVQENDDPNVMATFNEADDQIGIHVSRIDPATKEGDVGVLYYVPAKTLGGAPDWRFVRGAMPTDIYAPFSPPDVTVQGDTFSSGATDHRGDSGHTSLKATEQIMPTLKRRERPAEFIWYGPSSILSTEAWKTAEENSETMEK